MVTRKYSMSRPFIDDFLFNKLNHNYTTELSLVAPYITCKDCGEGKKNLSSS